MDPPDSVWSDGVFGDASWSKARRRSAAQIADESEFIAARLNVGTHRENVIGSTESLTTHWPARSTAGGRCRNPTFPENEVERVRKERLTDLRRVPRRGKRYRGQGRDGAAVWPPDAAGAPDQRLGGLLSRLR